MSDPPVTEAHYAVETARKCAKKCKDACKRAWECLATCAGRTKADWRRMEFRDRLGVLLNLLLFLAAVAAVVFTKKQWEASRDTLEATARAWMVMDMKEVKIDPCPPRFGSIVTVRLRNAGGGPAKNVRVHTKLITGTGKALPGRAYPFPKPLFGADASRAVVGPGQPYEATVTLEADPECTTGPIAAVPEGQSLFVYGIAKYRDGFTKKRGRVTKFCAYYSPFLEKDRSKYRFTFCSYFNEAT